MVAYSAKLRPGEIIIDGRSVMFLLSTSTTFSSDYAAYLASEDLQHIPEDFLVSYNEIIRSCQLTYKTEKLLFNRFEQTISKICTLQQILNSVGHKRVLDKMKSDLQRIATNLLGEFLTSKEAQIKQEAALTAFVDTPDDINMIMVFAKYLKNNFPSIQQIHAEYSGGGDSGEMHEVRCVVVNPQTEQSLTISLYNTFIKDMFEDYPNNNTQADWYNDHGGSISLVINFENNTISHDVYVNYVETKLQETKRVTLFPESLHKALLAKSTSSNQGEEE